MEWRAVRQYSTVLRLLDVAAERDQSLVASQVRQVQGAKCERTEHQERGRITV